MFTSAYVVQAVTVEKPRKNAGFPPGITVDELKFYRRKKSETYAKNDNIQLEEGSFNHLKTEYNRRFVNYFERFGELFQVITKPPTKSQLFADAAIDDDATADSKPPICQTSERRQLLKRPTNLKLEGSFYDTTEQTENFILHLLTKELFQRQSTTLRMEGELETSTENREQFVPFEVKPRPKLEKKKTNLNLDGELVLMTENREKFRLYTPPKRSERVKVGVEDKNRPLMLLPRNYEITDEQYDERMWKHKSQDFWSRESPVKIAAKRAPQLKLKGGGRQPQFNDLAQNFECEPEYRRAFINYLTRENLERQAKLPLSKPREEVRTSDNLPAIEAKLFGPKVEPDDGGKKKKVFKAVPVRNLVQKPTVMLAAPPVRNKWMRGSSSESSAFIVLDR